MASSHSTVKQIHYLHICLSSHETELYNPKTFIAHTASHCQAFAHCKRFSTAASRRSLGSVSVPVWLTILSDQLPVNSLGGPLPHQLADRTQAYLQTIAYKYMPSFTTWTCIPVVLSGIRLPFDRLSQS